MKPLILDLEHFSEWATTERVMYASESKTGKKLFVTLTGNIQIEVNGKIVWEGLTYYTAIEKFNEL